MAITRNSAIPKTKANEETSTPQPLEISINEEKSQNTDPETITEAPASDYEQCREQRIKENRERLQKMGIMDLSLKLKAMAPPKRNLSERKTKTPLKSPSLTPSEPSRRSARLQNVTPVTYTEPKEEKARRGRDILLEEGAKPEVYTEEHEKLLGNTNMPWTFFVDGYRPDGTRIYDPINGKTCHQCRQKTLGLRTHCNKCNLVQGQFCGDCLYMRYGEHVVEAKQNPDWICPACRGICNCSLCRQAKGWQPTGALYRRISSLGYKSVAHYLITTKRAPPETDNSAKTPQSVKRSLPFEGIEAHGDDGSGQELKSEKKANSQKKKATSDEDPKMLSEGDGGSRKTSKKEEPTSVEDPNMLSKGVGRPRKRTKKDEPISDEDPKMLSGGDGGSRKTTKKEEPTSVEDPNMLSKGVGRPRKRTKKDEPISDEDPKMLSGGDGGSRKSTKKEEPTSVEDPNMLSKGVGRPRKRTKKDEPISDEDPKMLSGGDGGSRKTTKKEEPTSVEDPNMLSKGVGRPRKRTKKDEPISGIEEASASASEANSVARQLRPRNRT